jgi:hypothetical protein
LVGFGPICNNVSNCNLFQMREKKHLHQYTASVNH